MKKVIPIVYNPKVMTFFVEVVIIANIEGRLNTVEITKQKNMRRGFENLDYHFIMTSVMHQKF
jgi:hypothetical protein